jgi:hypothetical protein
MMRTVTNTFLKRIEAQREEAKLLKMDKVASNLSHQIEHVETRGDDEFYRYSFEELQRDVEQELWAAAMRVQDFYGKTANAAEVQDLIELFASDLINSVRHKTGKIVGAYEETVPGERREVEAIEIEDAD